MCLDIQLFPRRLLPPWGVSYRVTLMRTFNFMTRTLMLAIEFLFLFLLFFSSYFIHRSTLLLSRSTFTELGIGKKKNRKQKKKELEQKKKSQASLYLYRWLFSQDHFSLVCTSQCVYMYMQLCIFIIILLSSHLLFISSGTTTWPDFPRVHWQLLQK